MSSYFRTGTGELPPDVFRITQPHGHDRGRAETNRRTSRLTCRRRTISRGFHRTSPKVDMKPGIPRPEQFSGPWFEAQAR